MGKLVVIVITSVASYLGWWLGDLINLYLAVVLSAIGTGVGVYFGNWLKKEYLP